MILKRKKKEKHEPYIECGRERLRLLTAIPEREVSVLMKNMIHQ